MTLTDLIRDLERRDKTSLRLITTAHACLTELLSLHTNTPTPTTPKKTRGGRYLAMFESFSATHGNRQFEARDWRAFIRANATHLSSFPVQSTSALLNPIYWGLKTGLVTKVEKGLYRLNLKHPSKQ